MNVERMLMKDQIKHLAMPLSIMGICSEWNTWVVNSKLIVDAVWFKFNEFKGILHRRTEYGYKSITY